MSVFSQTVDVRIDYEKARGNSALKLEHNFIVL